MGRNVYATFSTEDLFKMRRDADAGQQLEESTRLTNELWARNAFERDETGRRLRESAEDNRPTAEQGVATVARLHAGAERHRARVRAARKDAS